MEKPRAVLFDAYGTLFDVYSVGLLAEQLYPGLGQKLSVLWRDKQIEYTRLVTTSDHGAHYRPFWDLTERALRHSIKALVPAAREHWALHAEPASRLMNQYRHLSAFPENREVLQALKARGIATGILSNGDPEMLGIAVRSAGLEGLLDHVISVDAVGQIAFVSSNAWDALAATWFGFQTLWVNRQGNAFEELDTQPTRTGHSLREVLAFF